MKNYAVLVVTPLLLCSGMSMAQNRLPGQEITPQGAIVLKPYKRPALTGANAAGTVNVSTISPAAPTALFGAEPAPLANGMYGQIGYMALRASGPDALGTSVVTAAPKPAALRLGLGYRFSPHWAAEVMVASGAERGTDSITRGNGVVSDFAVKAHSIAAAYIVPRYQFTDNLGVFARLGYASSRLNWVITDTPTQAADRSNTRSYNGVSWGAGVNYELSETLSLQADYMSYYDKGGSQLQGASIGIARPF